MLLVLLLATGPVGGVMAKSCDADASGPEVTSSVDPHEGHSQHHGAQMDHDGDGATTSNQHCAADCCSGAYCSASSCGSCASALASNVFLPSNVNHIRTTPSENSVTLDKRVTSLYRPPRA